MLLVTETLDGGIEVSTEKLWELQQKALERLQAEADKIIQLIEVQKQNLTGPKCPVYEEVLDMQMFGLSRQIEMLVQLELISKEVGKQFLTRLDQKISEFHELIAEYQV
jgi:uncharacterized protein YlaN (UPF0358 family)